MSAQFTYSVAGPEGERASGQCDFLVVPTSKGEVGILAGHADLLALVVPGELRVSRGGTVEKIPVGTGIVEVRGDSVRILQS
jgi:F-type H+-transporting ATPase subunit epsilon